jgi:tubulin-folding cofactor B
MDPSSVSANGWLEDTSKVQKYEISDEDYNKRENTFRKYKEEQLRKDPEWCVEKEMAKRRGEEWVAPKKVDDPEHMAEEAAAMSVGDRCETYPGGNRGEVKYVGKIEGLPAGWWVGVLLDEPLGKNDGEAKGVKIFDCAPNYGLFLRPDRVKTGDFPPVDDFSDLGSDDEI